MFLRKECDRMCFRNNSLPIQEKNGASSTFVSRSACCGSPWPPAYSAGTLPMSSSVSWRHPHLEECPVRDYFSETDASLLGEIHRWGLFFRAESISAQKNPPSGIISPRRMHPCSEKSTVWDYFPELKASLPRKIHRLGLFSRGESIPARRIPPSGIISPRRMHPHVADSQ